MKINRRVVSRDSHAAPDAGWLTGTTREGRGATDSESHELEPARWRRRGAGWTRRNAGRTDKSHGQHLHKFQRGISKDWPFRSFKRTP